MSFRVFTSYSLASCPHTAPQCCPPPSALSPLPLPPPPSALPAFPFPYRSRPLHRCCASHWLHASALELIMHHTHPGNTAHYHRDGRYCRPPQRISGGRQRTRRTTRHPPRPTPPPRLSRPSTRYTAAFPFPSRAFSPKLHARSYLIQGYFREKNP